MRIPHKVMPKDDTFEIQNVLEYAITPSGIARKIKGIGYDIFTSN